MIDNNILVTAIGTFSSECVINSLRTFCNGKIVGCDIYPAEWHAISNQYDTVLKAPLVKEDNNYLEFIINTCNEYSIGIIIPSTDVEVDFFNKHRDFFIVENILVTIGTSEFLSIARNKQKLNDFFKTDPRVNSIKTYTVEEIEEAEFPLIAKPKNGRSSEGIYYLNSIEDIRMSLNPKEYIFQEVIEGQICTVDYVRSIETGNGFWMPRMELLRTKNGAGTTVEIFKCVKIDELVRYIGNKLNVMGCVNMEFIINNGEYYLIDINPRLSAGIGFSKLAGYDFVKNHLLSFMNKDIEESIGYDCFIAQKRMTDVILSSHLSPKSHYALHEREEV